MANNNLLDEITSQEEMQMAEPDDQQMMDEAMEEMGLMEMNAPIIADIRDKFEESERARRIREDQWLRNVNSFRGHDSHEARFRNSEQNKTFIRTTTVKVKAAYAQIVEALFADGSFPFSVSSTPVPDGVSEFAHLKTDMDEEVDRTPKEPESPLGGVGFEGDGFTPAPGSNMDNLEFLGGMKDELSKDGETPLAEGISRDGSPTIPIAKTLARRMQKIILDRLEESNARTEMRKAIFEMCLLGTGVMKGPFNINKELPRWEHDEDTGDMVYAPKLVKRQPCWNIQFCNIGF
jgi:hypothetical protein